MLKKSYYTEECYEDAKSFLERATKEEKRVKKLQTLLEIKVQPDTIQITKRRRRLVQDGKKRIEKLFWKNGA